MRSDKLQTLKTSPLTLDWQVRTGNLWWKCLHGVSRSSPSGASCDDRWKTATEPSDGIKLTLASENVPIPMVTSTIYQTQTFDSLITIVKRFLLKRAVKHTFYHEHLIWGTVCLCGTGNKALACKYYKNSCSYGIAGASFSPAALRLLSCLKKKLLKTWLCSATGLPTPSRTRNLRSIKGVNTKTDLNSSKQGLFVWSLNVDACSMRQTRRWLTWGRNRWWHRWGTRRHPDRPGLPSSRWSDLDKVVGDTGLTWNPHF